nr:hypothetical protein [Tanacetum cinerariifolium]
MSTRSSARNIFPPLDNPELTISRRSHADPTLLNNFEMATEGNSGPPVPDLRTMEELCQPSLNGRRGIFMKRRPEECYDLIENITAHHNDWDTSAQWSESFSSITSSSDPEIAALKAEIAEINKNLMRPPLAKLKMYMLREPIKGASHGQNPPSAYQAPTYQALGYQAPIHQPPIPQQQVVTTNEFTNYMKANDVILKNMQTNMTSLTNSNLELKNMFGQFMKMNTALSPGLFKGIRIDDTLTLSHLFYADDAIFIGKWERANVITIVRMLNCFFMASGLRINIHKSKLMGIGVSIEEVNAAANIIRCSTFSTPFTYLSIKVGMSSFRKKSWDEVIGKISARLSKWKIKTLSIGGRLTLIKSVLTSLPLYHMSLYKAPLGVLHDLESFRRKFLMALTRMKGRSLCSVGTKFWLQKKEGLVFLVFFALNRSLLFKWVWIFLSQGSYLWYRFIFALYGKRISFDCIGINLLALLKKKVGNGAHTFFWEDTWINDTPLSRTFPWLYALENKKCITVAEKISEASLFASFRRAPRGGAEEDQFIQLVDLVDSITISNSNDRWVWLLESFGEFSVHSARTYIDDLLLPTVGSPTIWVKVVSIKINIFAWKIYLDKLPTRLNLSLRGIDIPSIICPNCSLAGESCSHLFFSCSLARLLWSKVARWWDFDIPDFSACEEWITWFKTIRLPKVVKEVLEAVFYTMLWLIWKFRN